MRPEVQREEVRWRLQQHGQREAAAHAAAQAAAVELRQAALAATQRRAQELRRAARWQQPEWQARPVAAAEAPQSAARPPDAQPAPRSTAADSAAHPLHDPGAGSDTRACQEAASGSALSCHLSSAAGGQPRLQAPAGQQGAAVHAAVSETSAAANCATASGSGSAGAGAAAVETSGLRAGTPRSESVNRDGSVHNVAPGEAPRAPAAGGGGSGAAAQWEQMAAPAAGVEADAAQQQYTVVERYSPRNASHVFSGKATARRALAESLNAPTVALAYEVGLQNGELRGAVTAAAAVVVRSVRRCEAALVLGLSVGAQLGWMRHGFAMGSGVGAVRDLGLFSRGRSISWYQRCGRLHAVRSVTRACIWTSWLAVGLENLVQWHDGNVYRSRAESPRTSGPVLLLLDLAVVSGVENADACGAHAPYRKCSPRTVACGEWLWGPRQPTGREDGTRLGWILVRRQ